MQAILQLCVVSDHRRERKHMKLQEAQITAPKNKETDNCGRIKSSLTRKC